jgi:ribonuclease P/MRP protein subunit RPP1
MPFVDLSVRVDAGNPHALREHLVCCLDLGYRAVALDTRVDATDRNARAELLAGLEPLRLDVLTQVAADATSLGARPELVVLRRCTVRFAEPGELQEFAKAHDDVIRSYDILALEPTTERAFSSACANARADIITTTLGARPAFRLRAPALKAAAINSTAFEVSYNAALMDVAQRRNFFANAAAATRAVGENTGGGREGRRRRRKRGRLGVGVGRAHASCGRRRRTTQEERVQRGGGFDERKPAGDGAQSAARRRQPRVFVRHARRERARGAEHARAQAGAARAPETRAGKASRGGQMT